MINTERIRNNFKILEKINYLASGSTSLTPKHDQSYE